MDRVITQSKTRQRALIIGLAILVVMLSYALVLHLVSRTETRMQRIDASHLVISEVTQKEFSDRLNLRGKAMPTKRILLDTLLGGRVEARLVEPGEFVEKGQPLVRLSNTRLQLDVMSREAQMIEQLNFLRNTQMTMETNRLDLRRDSLEINLQLSHLRRQLKKTQPLVDRGVIAIEELEAIQENLDYFKARKHLNQERLQQQSLIRETQLAQLQESSAQLEANLLFARKNLENLLVKAPVSGVLSELQAEIGESKSQGARLGQIDVPGQFKLQVLIDEFYLDRVVQDMVAIVEPGSDKLSLTVSKINRRVTKSQFSVEIELPQEFPVTNGQSISVSLLLGNNEPEALLLSRGQFFNASGGRWVYVVNQQGDGAVRRSITLGRKNDQYFQVLSGLNAGDKVITSSYDRFATAEQLQFKG